MAEGDSQRIELMRAVVPIELDTTRAEEQLEALLAKARVGDRDDGFPALPPGYAADDRTPEDRADRPEMPGAEDGAGFPDLPAGYAAGPERGDEEGGESEAMEALRQELAEVRGEARELRTAIADLAGEIQSLADIMAEWSARGGE